MQCSDQAQQQKEKQADTSKQTGTSQKASAIATLSRRDGNCTTSTHRQHKYPKETNKGIITEEESTSTTPQNHRVLQWFCNILTRSSWALPTISMWTQQERRRTTRQATSNRRQHEQEERQDARGKKKKQKPDDMSARAIQPTTRDRSSSRRWPEQETRQKLRAGMPIARQLHAPKCPR